MSTITTFCRITGHARNLPKPCYFPLLPPISPAEAKRLCKITGRAQDNHNYSPIIAFGKAYSYRGLEGCKITKHEDLIYTKPTFIIYKDNEKTLGFLTKLLDKMKSKRRSIVDMTKQFVYSINDNGTKLVLPPEFEEAIRTGEIEYLSMHKNVDHLTVKIKQGRIVKVKVEKMLNCEIDDEEDYIYGEGQSKEALDEQQKIVLERNLRKKETMEKKRLFEEREQKADEEEKRANERPKSNRPPIRFDPLKRKQKLEQMRKMMEENKENSSIILPILEVSNQIDIEEQVIYEKMLDDLYTAQKKSINVTTVIGSNFDWREIEYADNNGFDWNSFPHEEEYEAIIVPNDNYDILNETNIERLHTLDIAASVQRLEAPPIIESKILEAIHNIEKDNLKTTENINMKLSHDDAVQHIPKLCNVNNILTAMDKLKQGYLVKDENSEEWKFISEEKYKFDSSTSIQGAEIMVDGKPTFVVGQNIEINGKSEFIAGQTVTDGNKIQFVPGLTVTDNNNQTTFIPGKVFSDGDQTTFVAGQTIENSNGISFVAGQKIDRGDGKMTFVPGQTILDDNVLKFVPGVFTKDDEGYEEFVPGMKMPSNEEEFIPGQVFQTENGISFVPGQIINTEEGPSFISGKCFETPNGEKKFVKGEIIKSKSGKIIFEVSKSITQNNINGTLAENGIENENELGQKINMKNILEKKVGQFARKSIIPNDDLQVTITTTKNNIAGFNVKPSNTSDIPPGQRLYGSIVQTDDNVLFYRIDELPNDLDPDAKIISGQLVVGEGFQRFIYGRTIETAEGEKFIPGQMVKTSHGEEFVPGQIIETNEGPKFIPGQLVMTSEGDKFIPGQVVYEEDGPKFVPGQIIHTNNGATFIPGQMMTTDEGQKFVPGQLVDTKDGPRFVPGQVVESETGPEFVPGTVVETEDGLKFLPNITGNENGEESDEESEISFQAFDICPEEALLIASQSLNNIMDASFAKELASVDSNTLQRLATEILSIHQEVANSLQNEKGKLRSKKRSRITIDAEEDGESNASDDLEDNGIDKVEILKLLMKIGNNISENGKGEELHKLGELLNINDDCDPCAAEIEAIKFINASSSQKDLLESYIGNDESLINEILNFIGDSDDLIVNDDVRHAVNAAVTTCITKMCDDKIDEIINKIDENPQSLFTDSEAQILLTEAVGIVCVTGDVEVASLLEKFISEPTNPKCLRDDPDVMSVLRQLLVLHRVAERDSEVADVLQELQDDPEGIKDRNKVRRLIKEAKYLLVKNKKPEKSFDIRHVASSKDIPKKIFEQISKDKTQAQLFIDKLPNELFNAIMKDKRCGEQLLDSLDPYSPEKSFSEVEKFKKGMAVVVAKDDMQAVIPKSLARSIYYGIIPYLLIDEEGFKYFERGLTGRKLAPSHTIENTWFKPDEYYEKSFIHSKPITHSGTQYNLVFLGNTDADEAPSMQYTSLITSQPKMISYRDNLSRIGSRAGSVTPCTRSSTPARKNFDMLNDRRNSPSLLKTHILNSLSPTNSYSESKNGKNKLNSFHSTRARSLHPNSFSDTKSRTRDHSSRTSSPFNSRYMNDNYSPKDYSTTSSRLSRNRTPLPITKHHDLGIYDDHDDDLRPRSRNGYGDFSPIPPDSPIINGISPEALDDMNGNDEIDFDTENQSFRKRLIEQAQRNQDRIDMLTKYRMTNDDPIIGHHKYGHMLNELRPENGVNEVNGCISVLDDDDPDDISDHVFRNYLRRRYTDDVQGIGPKYHTPAYPPSPHMRDIGDTPLAFDYSLNDPLNSSQCYDGINNTYDHSPMNGRLPFNDNYGTYRNGLNTYGRTPQSQNLGYSRRNNGSPYGSYHSRPYETSSVPLNKNKYDRATSLTNGGNFGRYTPFSSSNYQPQRHGLGGMNSMNGSSYRSPYTQPSLNGSSYLKTPLPPINRRFTPMPSHSHLIDDNFDVDDDDDDVINYNPKAEQRQMASEIAKKYILESDDED